MKTSSKVWLGIFTFLPLIILIVFLSLFFGVFIEHAIDLDNHYGDVPVEFIQSIAGFVLIIIVIALISLGVKIFYIVHTNNEANNETSKKILWTLILIFGGTIASVVYYFIEILPLKPEGSSENS